MKAKTIIQIILALVIVGMAYLLYSTIREPMRFDNEFNKRRAACATNLKIIRTLEDAYKQTYNCYCGNFDTLVNRLLTEDSLRIMTKVYHRELIPADVDIDDMPQLEAIKKGYITMQEVYVNPIAQFRELGKLKAVNADGEEYELTDNDLRNARYVPYPKDKKYEFKLDAGTIDKAGLVLPVFEAKVDLVDLMSDLDEQQVNNKIAELERINKYPGWKVGDMTQSITDGNFE